MFPAFLLPALLAGCGTASNEAPPHEVVPLAIPSHASAIAVPISASLRDLQTIANRVVPATLATIDKQELACVKVKIIGKISCHVVGTVKRGPITVGGNGNTLLLVMPVAAEVRVDHFAHVMKETATAAAIATATVKLDAIGDWQPKPRVHIEYRWTKKPGIDFLGQRLTFANKADPALQKLIKRLEADLPREIAKLHPRDKLAAAWAKAFTALSINRTNPPVWLRLSPQKLRFRRYHIENGRLTLELGAMALTETFVGQRPPDPVPIPLPAPAPRAVSPDLGFRFYMPVVADYAVLEPVLAKALNKLEKKPISLPGVGTVKPDFGKVSLYPTHNGRLAIGLEMKVATSERWIDARGTIWVTAKPFNRTGSQRVELRDLQIAGKSDSPVFQLLLAVVESPAVQAEIGKALSQNFAKDYSKVLGKAGAAISEKRLGAFILTTHIDSVENGAVYPAGQGLFMPVEARGTAALRYAPVAGS
ncbi:DUF4403 family protein [Sandarakinorhabdus sp.]|uniref:DUF4403 family protein n=1 Tax=Sandarakinorhabdus sp. TaxID=1916663 RepID=UPI00333F33C2